MVLQSELRDEDIQVMSVVADRAPNTVDPAILFSCVVSNVSGWDLFLERSIIRLSVGGTILGSYQWFGEGFTLKKKVPSNNAEFVFPLTSGQRAFLERVRQKEGGLVLEIYFLVYIKEMERPVPASLRTEVQGLRWDEWSRAWGGTGGDLTQRLEELERQVELIKSFVTDTDNTFNELLTEFKRSELTEKTLESMLRSTKAIEAWVARQSR